MVAPAASPSNYNLVARPSGNSAQPARSALPVTHIIVCLCPITTKHDCRSTARAGCSECTGVTGQSRSMLPLRRRQGAPAGAAAEISAAHAAAASTMAARDNLQKGCPHFRRIFCNTPRSSLRPGTEPGTASRWRKQNDHATCLGPINVVIAATYSTQTRRRRQALIERAIDELS